MGGLRVGAEGECLYLREEDGVFGNFCGEGWCWGESEEGHQGGVEQVEELHLGCALFGGL